MATVLLTLAALVVSCGARTSLDGPAPQRPVAILDPNLAAACTSYLSCIGSFAVPQQRFYRSISDCIWRNAYDDGWAVDWDSLGPPAGKGLLPTLDPNWFGKFSTSCLAHVGGCDGVRRCLNGGIPRDCSTNPARTCAGNLLLMCGGFLNGPQDWAVDCGLGSYAGNTCIPDTPWGPQCATGTCDAPPDVPCDGNIATACDGHLLFRSACTHGVCTPFEGNGSCEGDGPVCTQDRCEGDVFIDCADGREMRFDCTRIAVRATCRTDPDLSTLADCVPSLSLRCDPSTHVDQCEGSDLVYCDGVERMMDCRSLGFGGCGTLANGVTACQ